MNKIMVMEYICMGYHMDLFENSYRNPYIWAGRYIRQTESLIATAGICASVALTGYYSQIVDVAIVVYDKAFTVNHPAGVHYSNIRDNVMEDIPMDEVFGYINDRVNTSITFHPLVSTKS